MLFFPDKQTIYAILSRKVENAYCVEHMHPSQALEGQVSFPDALGFFVSMTSPSSEVSVLVLRKEQLIADHVDPDEGEVPGTEYSFMRVSSHERVSDKNFGIFSYDLIVGELSHFAVNLLTNAFGFIPRGNAVTYDCYVDQSTAAIGKLTINDGTNGLYMKLQEQEGYPGARGQIVYLEEQ